MTSGNDDRITDKSRNVKLVLCFNASAIGWILFDGINFK